MPRGAIVALTATKRKLALDYMIAAMPPDTRKLDEELARQHAAYLRQAASTIRAWPPGNDRDDAACRLIRELMVEHTLRRITSDERNVLFGILSFALPSIAHRAVAQEQLPRDDDVAN